MPILKFKSPEGNIIQVNSPDGSMPSEQELDKLFSLSKNSSGKESFLQQGQNNIAQSQSTRETPEQSLQSLDFKQHPFVSTLKTIAAPFNTAESSVAAPALAAQRGDIGQILPEALKGITGQSTAQLGDIARGVNAPETVASTLGLLASFGAGGVNPKSLIGEEASGAAGKTASAIGSKTQEATTPLAARINNSLIKPATKALLYGNPGRGIAKEGLVGTSLSDLGQKVETRLGELTANLENHVSANQDLNINLKETVNPLLKLVDELSLNPATNKADLDKIGNILSDIGDNAKTRFNNLERISPKQAIDFKRYIGDFQDWESVGGKNHDINVAIKNVYHNIDNAIDTAIPETKQINQRLTDLITASKAIKNRQLSIQKSNLLGVPPILGGIAGGLVGHGAPGVLEGYLAAKVGSKVLGSTPAKTGLAHLLSQKYPALK